MIKEASDSLKLSLQDEEATIKAGAKLALVFIDFVLSEDHAIIVYLEGDLGAGKTTLTRGLIHSLGFAGVVKSPTFTIVEPYQVANLKIYHFDLYRLADPEELLYLGGRDYYEKGSLCLVEWPSLGQGVLPKADVKIKLLHQEQGRTLIIENQQLPKRFNERVTDLFKGSAV